MTYLIDVPPPTISGELHLGHLFSYSQMNFIAQYHRRKSGLLFPFCFDCNGIPTEKLASKNGIKEQDKIIQFAEETSIVYRNLFSTMGIQWSDETYHTFDANAIKMAELSFHDLVNKGLAYKAEREYFYCPITKVSVSQSEIDDNGCYERSGAKVETRFGEGWFIDILNHLPRIRQAIDEINWRPEHYKYRLHRWLDDAKYDWSISRERFFGIPIPGEKPGIVFDTWFMSSLTPQLTWASHTNPQPWCNPISLACPIFDARFQSHDIIRTWALYTIVKSLYHNDQIPWKNIVISGHVLDKDGNKFSKSSGNAGNPLVLINRYGAESIRYWAANHQLGSDAKVSEDIMRQTNRLRTKLKNAKRFLGMNENTDINNNFQKEWNETREKIEQHFENFGFFDAITLLNSFFWDSFCSVMIEHGKKEPCSGTLNVILEDVISLYGIFGITMKEDDNASVPHA